jgi:lipopolysaccharide assembly outer membrane protein LptD (OstA)
VKNICSTFILFLFILSVSHSQQAGDTLLLTPIDTNRIASDTTIPVTDSTIKNTGGLDAIVEYSANDSAIFDVNDKKMMLYNNGELKYKEFDLKAARITLFRENSMLEAHGIPDTSGSGKYIGKPVFFEGPKKYEGFSVKYNFITKQGNISMGSTELEGGYYLGEKIKKVSDDVFFVQNGRYTTCDKEEPDYYFGSPKMKIMQGDKIVAEPVYLFIDDVPIFAIPFGIFPNHTGRSSGLIPPAYGEDATYGRYLSHLGYFWAINDFMDLSLTGNYFTKGRIDLSARYRYVKRYLYNGTIELGGTKIRLGEQNDLDRQFSDEWQIAATHFQTFNPTTSINANINFLSSKNYYNNSTNNLNDLLLQHAISNVTFTKYWEGTPNSFSANYYRDQNLQTGEIYENIPGVTFIRSQTYPFRGRSTSLLEPKWYESISYTYNAQLINNHSKTQVINPDATKYFITNARGGLRQSVIINSSVKVSEFSLTPFFNYNETWYNKYITKSFNPANNTAIIEEHAGFKTFRTFSTGISLQTRVIGIFNTGIFGIKGIRHTVTPALSFSFQPDFSQPQWNIYGNYIDTAGKPVKYSFFEREIFGYPGSGKTQALNFGIGNLFEMKTKSSDTTDNKFQLLNLNAGGSYNFAADSLKFSEIGLTYTTSIASFLSIGGGASFNFYKYIDNVGRINKFLWSTDKRIADLTRFSISVSTSFQSSNYNSSSDTVKDKNAPQTEYVGMHGEKAVDFSIPWSVNLNYYYGIQKPTPSSVFKTSSVNGSLSFSLTQNWKFTFSAGYDLVGNSFSAPYLTIYRDLHCWEINFNWIPVGLYRGFRFELRIKAPQLQDIKVLKQSNYRGALY